MTDDETMRRTMERWVDLHFDEILWATERLQRLGMRVPDCCVVLAHGSSGSLANLTTAIKSLPKTPWRAICGPDGPEGIVAVLDRRAMARGLTDRAPALADGAQREDLAPIAVLMGDVILTYQIPTHREGDDCPHCKPIGDA